MNKVTVQIYGQDYTITGSRSESEIRKIADRVDQQMKANYEEDYDDELYIDSMAMELSPTTINITKRAKNE